LNDPFPHFTLRGFFADDVYSSARQLLPTKEHFAEFQYSSAAPEGEGTRWRFDMSDAAIDRLEPSKREFWRGVRDALGCDELKRAVYRKLGVGLGFRYSVPSDKTADLPGYALPAMFREEEGYCIKPHPDTRKKVVTMQIALPVDDSQSNLGTEFYRRSLNPLSLMRQPRGFDIAKTAQFVPNAAYAFVVLNTLTKKSWHGRSTLSSQDGVRNSILNIWHEKPEHGHPDVVRDHYQVSRAA